MASESESTRAFCEELKRMNAVVFAIVGHKMQEAGWPDRYIHHRRWRGFVEFKKGTEVSAKQRVVIKRLNERHPGSALIVRWPGFIEDVDGNVLAEFDGTAKDFFEALRLLEIDNWSHV